MTAGNKDADIDLIAVGRSLYEKLREHLEATNKGSFVVIDARTGDYEVDPSPVAAKLRLVARQPAPELYERRIGRPESYRMVSIRRAGGNGD